MPTAQAVGLTEAILPERNAPDLDDVPAEVRDKMLLHVAGTIDEVLGGCVERRVRAAAA